jgi:hypothetical protein
MIKKALSSAIAASLLTASAISFANEEAAETTTPAPAAVTAPAAISAPTAVLNPMNPATFIGFIDPNTHYTQHQAVANPAQWGQFMQPAFFMQMTDPQQAMQWANPAAYQALMNPSTYMYWMNPAAYTKGTAQVSSAATGGTNWFDMGAWTNMMQPAPQATPEKEEG